MRTAFAVCRQVVLRKYMIRSWRYCIAWSVIALALLAESASGQRPQVPIGAQKPPRLHTASVSTGLNTAPLNIHGPFVLGGADFAKLRETTAPQVKFITEESNTIGNTIGPSRPLPPRGNNPSGNDTGKTGPFKPLPVALAAPQPNPAVVSGSAGVIDPQIAVGGNDVMVTLRNNILLFKKSDLIGKPTGANVNAQVITTDKFFTPLTADINQHLNQPKGYGVNEGYGINPAAFPGNTYYDARLVYDNYRKRFWIIALAITQKASPAIKETCADPIRQSARRTKVAVAVSQGDDAFGAWNYYWWDANKDEDTDPRITSKYFSHVDYPLLGISEKFLLVENKADICQTGPGICGNPPVPSCTPPQPNLQTENYDYVTAAPADALATGNVPAGKTAAFGFKNFKYPDGTVIPPGNSLAPTVHDGSVPFGVSFFVNPYVDSNGKSSLMVWYLDAGNLNSPTFSSFTVPIRPLQRINSPRGVPTAAFRGQELTVALAETIACTSPSSITAIRVIRVNVVTGKVIIDSTTGRRSPLDPANIDCVGYFQPAIQVNKSGDTAFVYMREAKGTVPTEARYTVIYHGSLAQPPSVQLQAGKTDVGGGFDTSGISLDPDDQAIWFVAPYGSATGAQIAIGRIWGK